MDRNDLLAATRAQFIRDFSASLDDVIYTGVAHLFSKADAAPTLPEQGKLLDARNVLMNKDIALKRHLVDAMEHLLNRSFQTAYSTFRPSFYDSINAQSLSLIDASTFEDNLYVDGLTLFFREAAEDEWRDLNIRIALLFEQEDIKERENPFRTYLFARCIISALEKMDIPGELHTALTQQISESLAGKIVDIYKNLNQLLANHGIAAQLQLKIRKSPDSVVDISTPNVPTKEDVVPAIQRPLKDNYTPVVRDVAPKGKVDRLLDWVSGRNTGGASAPAALSAPLQNPSRDAVGSSYHPGDEGASHLSVANVSDHSGVTAEIKAHPEKRSWFSGAQAMGEVLRNFFAGEKKNEQLPESYVSFQPDATISNPKTTALHHSVQGMQQRSTPDFGAMFDQDGRVRNLILERRSELSIISSSTSEQMVIDVVAMLFEFILRDLKVPAEVRAQLGRLQFLVLKIALQDPALFTHKNHPARMLVNRIGSIVQELQTLDPNGERLTTEICRIVEVLLADTSEEVTIFSRMLDDFDQFVATELRTADGQVERAVQVVEHVESRALHFARISSMIAEGMIHLKLDAELHDFLVNTWARVIEKSGRSNETQAKRFRELVPNLIWSVIPKVAEDERKELFGLIPNLLATLREGLILLGWDAERQNQLQDWLVEMHRRALRAAQLPAPVPPFSYVLEQFSEFVQTREEDEVALDEDYAFIPDSTFMAEAIQEMEAEITDLDMVFEEEMGRDVYGSNNAHLFDDLDIEAQEELPPVQHQLSVMDRLRSGVAIEIRFDEDNPAKGRLNWVSPVVKNVVLSIENTPMPMVISIKVFERLLQTGRISFIEEEQLFERAVQSLLESADNLDSSTTEEI